jgi:hypothetical protein
MAKVLANTLRVGDVILPPDRELRLWMRRDAQARGLPESALYLTVTDVREGNPDKGGRWLIVTSDQTPEWNGDRVRPYPFKFKVRPETPWTVMVIRGSQK